MPFIHLFCVIQMKNIYIFFLVCFFFFYKINQVFIIIDINTKILHTEEN